jgi:hypothetical protein
MKFRIFQFIFSLLVIIFATVFVSAQADASTSNGKPKPEDFPKNIRETLKKQEIERNKKDHEKMLENGEEAVQLSQELTESFEKTNRLSAQDVEKLERIEKLVKKIRSELGGDEEEEIEEAKPSTLEVAIKTLKNTTVSLLDELKKTTRYSISAAAIQSSNSLLDIVRFLRFWKK